MRDCSFDLGALLDAELDDAPAFWEAAGYRRQAGASSFVREV